MDYQVERRIEVGSDGGPRGTDPPPDGSHRDNRLQIVLGCRTVRGRSAVRSFSDGLRFVRILLLRAAREHLEGRYDDLCFPMALPCVVVLLTRLEASVHVDQLALRQELAADLRQPVPGHARVVLGPLPVRTAVLVRRDREGL